MVKEKTTAQPVDTSATPPKPAPTGEEDFNLPNSEFTIPKAPTESHNPRKPPQETEP